MMATALVVVTASPVSARTSQPVTVLAIAQSQVGTTPSYAAKGFWCGKFVQDVFNLAHLQPLFDDGPNNIYADMRSRGLLATHAQVGGLVFLRNAKEEPVGLYDHVGFIEALLPRGRAVMISGNRLPDFSHVSRAIIKIPPSGWGRTAYTRSL